MFVRMDEVSTLIPLNGSIILDGVEYSETVDCRTLIGEHELEGEFDFMQMTASDRTYVLDKQKSEARRELAAVTMELLDAQYQLITGEVLV